MPHFVNSFETVRTQALSLGNHHLDQRETVFLSIQTEFFSLFIGHFALRCTVCLCGWNLVITYSDGATDSPSTPWRAINSAIRPDDLALSTYSRK